MEEPYFPKYFMLPGNVQKNLLKAVFFNVAYFVSGFYEWTPSQSEYSRVVSHQYIKQPHWS